jgi:signal transduction histidine kinase
LSRIWIFTTVIITGILTLALFWLPLPGIWWHVTRGIYYLPILLVSVRYGPLAGLSAGLAASLLYAFAADSRGLNDMAWFSVLIPDFALVGLLGGRFLKTSTRFSQVSFASGSNSWSRFGNRASQTSNNIDLNPLASIQSAAGLLCEDDTPREQRQELAGIISTECEILSASIQGLLQLGHGPSQAQFSQSDLGALINAAIQEVEFILGGHGVLVHREITPDPLPVECDPDQIRSLLMTLIINTVQSLPPGSTVLLATNCHDGGVELEIKQQGRESFLRGIVNRLSSSRPSATGVALANAYEIVQQHSGRIRSNRNVRKGLEFSVWLPLRRRDTNGGWQSAGGGGR